MQLRADAAKILFMTTTESERNNLDASSTDRPSSCSATRTLRVCSFESRKQAEMRSLIERHGGVATVAPSMREVPLENNPAVFEFLDRLQAGQIDVVVFMTGVGARALLEVVETRLDRAAFFPTLERCCIVVRGPKPTAVLREWDVHIDQRAPEPNTWHEVLSVIDAELHGRTVAIQEYGQPSSEFYAALAARGATVLPVPVYRWDLPEDLAPLEAAIRDTTRGRFDVLLFTSAQQIRHALQVAERLGCVEAFLTAANRGYVASIGPTCSEALREAGLRVDREPSHPHMGHLVRETLERVAQLPIAN
jgi:uroporphyrinogen-III synthase